MTQPTNQQPPIKTPKRKLGRYVAALTASVIGLASCNSLKILDTITPHGKIQSKQTFSTGETPRQAYDFYTPTTLKENSPILVYVYGGGWTDGARGLYRFIADSFAAEGYRVAVADYRLHPEVNFPSFIEDIAATIADIHTRNPDAPLIIMGHSAGAYNIMMVALNDTYLGKHDLRPCDVIAGAVGVAGPYGVYPMTDPAYFEMFPNRLQGEESTMNFANANAPPSLLISGADEDTVSPENAKQLGAKLTQLGADSRVIIYPGQNHTDPIRVLSRWFDGKSTNRQDILTFMEKYGTKAACND